MVQLGSKVRDQISGFTGIATGRATYLFGCVRVLVEPQELKDGKPIESQWIDEQRLKVLKEGGIETSPDSSAESGGPQNDPPKF